MSRAKTWCALALLATGSACQNHPSQTTAPAQAKAALPTETAPADVKALLSAEIRRDSAAIGAQGLSTRDVAARRLAARALARIADATAIPWLHFALADEDSEVVTWGAYGLGYTCLGRETKTVPALALRAASLSNDSADRKLASPGEAISDALGRCGGAEAEATLRHWLNGPIQRAEAAALALGRIASQSGKLEDATLVALLDSADRGAQSLTNALYPLSRLSSLNASTSDRARSVSLRILQTHVAGAEFALRALAHTGVEGASALGSLLPRADFPAGLRAEAVRELSALGEAGQRLLWAAFSAGDEPTSDAALLSAEYGPFSALLGALKAPVLGSGSGSQLQALAELKIAEGDPPSLKRRKVHARCTAAALLAGSNFQSPQLQSCDPAADSPTRERRVLEVIGREVLRGSRKRAYLQHTQGSVASIHAAAIDLLAEHNELAESYQVLADALGAKSLGVVASAARVLASYPERATRPGTPTDTPHNAPNPDLSVISALTLAYANASAQSSVEVQSLLLDALGSLQILSLKDTANAACTSDNPTLREHGQRALRLLGEQSRHCDGFTPGPETSVAPELSARSLLTLETEAGTLTLTLDPTLAPNAVARIVTLAQAGFYDGMAVHRVVPGFVAQFGDPSGDGYGGDGHPPLRCETSPVPFGAGSVGIALSGRDTGSSQLFVTLGRYPHLDGQYAWLGQAGPGWDRVAIGDRIVQARVSSVR